MLVNASKKSPKIPTLHMCDCGKMYKHVTSYYRHKKVCNRNLYPHALIITFIHLYTF